VGVVRQALDYGLNLFDTAPSYGAAEEILGLALADAPDCIVCTKLSIPRDESGQSLRGHELLRMIDASVQTSLRRLRRDRIDLLQIHNATSEVLDDSAFIEHLLRTKDRGDVRNLGASVYTEAEALCVVEQGSFDALQIPYSLLDQKMKDVVLPAAAARDVGVIARSVLLKGALTEKVQWLPPMMNDLKQATEEVRDSLGLAWSDLPGAALRFCLGSPLVSTALVGARDLQELSEAVSAVEKGPLCPTEMKRAETLGLDDEVLVNPSRWPIP
jgi:aryl-alcohol dehydrogenase-like predicted oxidoreductase